MIDIDCYDTHMRMMALAMANCHRGMDREQIERAVELFHTHPRVIFCTMGKSAFACAKVAYTARSYGLDWHELDVCHAFHGDSGIIKEDDLLIMVSKSGETKETVEVAKYFREWQTLSVCSDRDSTLSKYCRDELRIPVTSEASPLDGYAPMVSTTLYMAVFHAILTEVVVQSDITLEDYAQNHPGGTIGSALNTINVGGEKFRKKENGNAI